MRQLPFFGRNVQPREVERFSSFRERLPGELGGNRTAKQARRQTSLAWREIVSVVTARPPARPSVRAVRSSVVSTNVVVAVADANNP